MLYAKFGWVGLMVLEEMKKNDNFCNDDENDDEGQWTNFDKKNSHKPSARVS